MPKDLRKKKHSVAVMAVAPSASLQDEHYYPNLLNQLKLNRQTFEALFKLPEQTEKTAKRSYNTREEVHKIVQKLIHYTPSKADYHIVLQSLNYIIQNYTEHNPSFFIKIIRQLSELNERSIGFTLLFNLRCITTETIPSLHHAILLEILNQNSLELLFYYLTNQPLQIKKTTDSGLLSWLIINAPIFLRNLETEPWFAQRVHLNYLFKLFSHLSPTMSQIIYNKIIEDIPFDFPWPEGNKAALNLVGVCLGNIARINQSFNDELRIKYPDCMLGCDLTALFSEAFFKDNWEPLKGFFSKILQLPQEKSFEVLKLLFHALIEVGDYWSNCSVVAIIDEEMKIFRLSLSLLDLFVKNNDFLRGNAFYEQDSKVLKSFISAITYLNFNELNQLYQEYRSLSGQAFSRKQYQIVKLIYLLMLEAHQQLGDAKANKRIDEHFYSLLKSLESEMGRIDARIFAFEDSAQYQLIQAKFPELPYMLQQDFKGHFFKSLQQKNTQNLAGFFKEIHNETHQIALLKLIQALVQETELRTCMGDLYNVLQNYSNQQLECLTFQISAQLILNTTEIYPILLMQGMAVHTLDLFFRAYKNRNFYGYQQELADFFIQVSQTEHAFIVRYFRQIMDYYCAILPAENFNIEKTLVTPFLLALRKNEKIMHANPLITVEKPAADKQIKENIKKLDALEPQSQSVIKDYLPQELLAKPLVFDEILFIRASRKKWLYSLYLDFFNQLHLYLDNPVTVAEIKDGENYANIYKRITLFCSTLIEQQHAVLEACTVSVPPFEFRFKEETHRLWDLLHGEKKLSSTTTIFTLHNQVVSALAHEVRSQNKVHLCRQEELFIQHADEYLVLSFASMSLKQHNLLFWLQNLIPHVEAQALKEDLFVNCQAGFLQAGVYGSFIAKAFQLSQFVPLSENTTNPLMNHQEDIDCTIYVDKNLTGGHALTIKQHRRIAQLMNVLLPEEARSKARDYEDFSTWHGFFYQGQACDITLQSALPIPVISHCSILFNLNKNKVQFLEQGEHVLLHIRANKLNIIAPEKQWTDPIVMAHVLKKVLGYLQSGMRLSRHSKTILGDLLLNEPLALSTICRFISFYGHQKPEWYSHLFMHGSLPILINKQEVHISLAQYLIGHCLSVYDHLEKESALKALMTIDFKPFFIKMFHQSILKDALYQYIHLEISQYEKRLHQSLVHYTFYKTADQGVANVELKLSP